ncbi:MAG: exonuclease subunit SbcD, partial [Cocleimonas sp.]|nr:exonuclease subunit SbcD [Cocleimonas sp.]
MQIIHTSDWHLGQNFMGKSRAAEHRAFLSWLLVQIETHKVDVLLVVGDIFDTGSPPSYAREIYNRFIVDMQRTGCLLVVLGGNHDSVAMLNESSALLACLNTLVVTTATGQDEQIIPLKNLQGEVGAILCAIPFIRQRDVLVSKAGQSGAEKQQAMQQAIAGHYQMMYQKAEQLRDTYD